MITFGNEELLADGREELPRIIDIARPTRLTIELSNKIFSLGSLGTGVTIALYCSTSPFTQNQGSHHENLLQIYFNILNQTPLQGTCNQHCDGG